MTPQDVMALIKEKDVRAVDVRFVDLPVYGSTSRCRQRNSP